MGIHWRHDIQQAILLGEAVAISLPSDRRTFYNDHYGGFTFTSFNGNTI